MTIDYNKLADLLTTLKFEINHLHSNAPDMWSELCEGNCNEIDLDQFVERYAKSIKEHRDLARNVAMQINSPALLITRTQLLGELESIGFSCNCILDIPDPDVPFTLDLPAKLRHIKGMAKKSEKLEAIAYELRGSSQLLMQAMETSHKVQLNVKKSDKLKLADAIAKAYILRYATEHRRIPTVREISDNCGCGVGSVEKLPSYHEAKSVLETIEQHGRNAIIEELTEEQTRENNRPKIYRKKLSREAVVHEQERAFMNAELPDLD